MTWKLTDEGVKLTNEGASEMVTAMRFGAKDVCKLRMLTLEEMEYVAKGVRNIREKALEATGVTKLEVAHELLRRYTVMKRIKSVNFQKMTRHTKKTEAVHEDKDWKVATKVYRKEPYLCPECGVQVKEKDKDKPCKLCKKLPIKLEEMEDIYDFFDDGSKYQATLTDGAFKWVFFPAEKGGSSDLHTKTTCLRIERKK